MNQGVDSSTPESTSVVSVSVPPAASCTYSREAAVSPPASIETPSAQLTVRWASAATSSVDVHSSVPWRAIARLVRRSKRVSQRAWRFSNFVAFSCRA